MCRFCGSCLCCQSEGGTDTAKKRVNGEGNIRKRKDGRWEGRYTAGYDEKTGKRLIKNVLGKTQAEVKEKLAKAVAEAESIDVRRADEYTLGTWLQTWYELYAKPHLRFSTAEYYRRGIELHITPRIGDIPLKKLTGRNNAGEPDITRPKTENSIRKSRFHRMPSICWSQSTRNTPAILGCSHHLKRARCTTRTRWSTSTRKS